MPSFSRWLCACLLISPLRADLAWLDFQATNSNPAPLHRAVPAVAGGTVTTNGLSFTLSGSGLAAADRGLADTMLSDFIYVDGAGKALTLLIQGLPAGTYAVDSYHYDGGGFAGAIRVEAHQQATPANNTVVLANFAFSTAAASYTFTTDGTPVELVFRENGANDRVRLNGLRLRLAGTRAGPPGLFMDIDATNTAAVGGTPSPFSSDVATTGNLWRRRPGFGFNVTANREIYEKDANSGIGDAAKLVTTITGLVPGRSYGVHIAYISVPAETWQVKGGLSANALELFLPGSSSDRITDLGLSAESGSNRRQYLGYLGNAVADAGGTIQAYADDGDSTDASGLSRSWLEGFFVGDPVVPPAPLPVPEGAVEVAPDGAWTWFNDERAIVHQGSLFSGYVKSNGTYGISRRDLSTGVNSHMIVSTAASQQQDDHNNPSITVLPDGKLLILYSKHNSTAVYYQRTSLVPLPTTAADWGPEITRTVPASNTYANTYRLSGEANTLYNFHRCVNFNPTLTISTDLGATWGASRLLIGTGAGGIRPYPRYCSNGVDRVDLIYTDGHPRDVPNSVYHMYYRAGSFYKTDGTFIKALANLPLDHDGGERGSALYTYSNAAWGAGQGPNDWIPTGRGWTWDIHYGQGGAPVAVFQVQRDDQSGSDWKKDRIYYYYARWTGTAWERRMIAQGGRPIYAAEDDYGGGMCLDPEDPRIVYFSSNAASPLDVSSIDNVALNANERYELYRGFTADGGLTFTWTQLTTNSDADNLRPIVPVGHGRTECLLWFNGTYTTYTSFSTRVLARIGAPGTSYSDWSQQKGISAAPATADNDADGLPNLLEFGLGGDPLDAASRPTTEFTPAGVFSFPCPCDLSGVELQVQESLDLMEWDTVAVLRTGDQPATIAPDYTVTYTPAPERRAVVTPANISGLQKFFLRLKIVLTE
ncbi:MAG: BNR-4 repeat-containing protein [Burkholderiales bacterium]|nr:BNR-4 repeat-containing protein [Opitutaceae bacterium]